MEKTDKQAKLNLWKNIARVSAAMAIVISVLLILNFVQLNRLDPVNTEIINSLVERLSENPGDQVLREEIRELDLLARKAYFTNQWQIKSGTYLLIAMASILLVALHMLNASKKINPVIPDSPIENVFLRNKKSRIYVALGGLVLVIVAVSFASLSRSKIEHLYDNNTVKEQNLANAEKEIIKKKTEETKVVPPVEKINETIEEIKPNEEKPIEKKPIQANQNLQKETTPKEKELKKEETITPENTASSLQFFPNFRGINGLGIAYASDPPLKWNGETGEQLVWKKPIPLHGYNSPIVWGNKVFLSGANNEKRELYCYDLNSGALLWTLDVTALINTSTGAPEVTDDTGHAAPTAATNGQMVYVIFSNGDLVASDLNGKMVWAKNIGMPDNHYGHSSSLLIYKDKLIVQFDDRKDPKLMALSTNSGEILWSTKRDVKISWASPALINYKGKTQIAVVADPYIAAYCPDTGEELWKVKGISGEVGPSVAYADGIVFGVNEYAKLSAIDLSNPTTILWEDDEYLSEVPSPIATKEHLFMGTSWGAFICYNAKTGEKIWEHEFDNGFYGSPILIMNNIYIVDRTGNTLVFKAGPEFQLIAENPLGEKSDCTPAFANGKILIRGEKHLFCFGKK